MKHIIDTGYTFQGYSILLQTDKPGVTGKFRKLIFSEILEPIHNRVGDDVKPERPWEDPLERTRVS